MNSVCLFSHLLYYVIRTTQSDLYQMDAIASFVDFYGWKEVIAVFVDDDFGRNGVAALNDKLAGRRLRITYKAGLHPDTMANKNEIKIIGKVSQNNGEWLCATDWLSTTVDSSSPLPSERLETIQGVLVLRRHTPSNLKWEFFSRWRNIYDAPLALNAYGLYAYDLVMLLARVLDKFFNHGGKILFSNGSMLDALGKSGNPNLEAMTVFDGGETLLKDILGMHMATDFSILSPESLHKEATKYLFSGKELKIGVPRHLWACYFLFAGIVVWNLEHWIHDELFRCLPKRQCITILWFSFPL
ncbi:unnamed protein product [Arabis nemorensis]|uniref:Receptor ligand binding region domain-containing protein n=1 Tax=Arabis nemorensis TaxID=586526 RepID=A0A565CMY6_9BRAS|nr:unnamed protein product [Arabis nemorensis]